MKFKKGEKVTIVKCLSGHFFEIGTVVTIIEVNEDDDDYLVQDNKTNNWYVGDDELKK